MFINSRIQVPLREIRITFVRSSGPGGQNVNKLSTKALLRWPAATSPSLPEAVRERLLAKHRRRLTAAGDLLIVSQRFRDAGRNAADCLEKLRQMVCEAARTPAIRKPTKPTRASLQRRLKQKQKHAHQKRQRRAAAED